MHRSASSFTLLAAFTLAACSPDLVAPVMAPSSPSFAKSVAPAGRHIVLVNGSGKQQAFAARVTELGGRVVSFHEGAGIAVVAGLTGPAATQLAASGMGDVQPDFQISLDVPVATAKADATGIAADQANSSDFPSKAVLGGWQWNMKLIDAAAAWKANKLGSKGVTVAIIDTGLDYDILELKGLVDLKRSVSFMDTFVGVEDDPTTATDEYTPIVPADDDIVKSTVITAKLGERHPVTDLNGHGTNVASQVSSNAVYLAGVTSKTTLFGVKVLGANGYGDFSDIINGVLYAADNGADIANMSLGGGFSRAGNGWYVGFINRTFNYARQKGMLVVVAAGNSGADLQHNGNAFSTYCDAPHVICVSAVGPGVATGSPDEPSFFTNYGRSTVDIAAPGGNARFDAKGLVVSDWPWGKDIASWVWSFCSKSTIAITRNKLADGKPAPDGTAKLDGCEGGGSLTGNVGTSQASPHVAGLAALLVAEKGRNPEMIKQIIQQSADASHPLLGRGRINVKTALGL